MIIIQTSSIAIPREWHNATTCKEPRACCFVLW